METSVATAWVALDHRRFQARMYPRLGPPNVTAIAWPPPSTIVRVPRAPSGLSSWQALRVPPGPETREVPASGLLLNGTETLGLHCPRVCSRVRGPRGSGRRSLDVYFGPMKLDRMDERRLRQARKRVSPMSPDWVCHLSLRPLAGISGGHKRLVDGLPNNERDRRKAR